MGYIRHTAIVVTSWNDAHIKEAHKEADRLGLNPSLVLPSKINGFRTILIPPTGSKIGWTDANEGEKAMDDFCGWLRSSEMYFEWARVDYGDDDHDAAVTDHPWKDSPNA
jgi:hypothetical protein